MKKQFKTIIDTALTGAAIGSVGNAFPGTAPANLRGLGEVTQISLAAGLATRTAKRNKIKL